jgi:phage shock protein C
MAEGKRLTRSRDDRMIAGVCAGLANYLGWPVNRVRIAYVVLSILSAAFPGLLVYLILWYLMPDGPQRDRTFRVADPADR